VYTLYMLIMNTYLKNYYMSAQWTSPVSYMEVLEVPKIMENLNITIFSNRTNFTDQASCISELKGVSLSA
jgi:hypothetical protein